MHDLKGKVAVVTGAASGIGLALADRFAQEGMKVVLADVEAESLDRAVTSLAGAEVMGVRTDVSQTDSVEALARTAIDRFGAVHVVCNNAGVGGQHYPVWEAPLPYWEWVLSVNLLGVIHGLRTFLPILLDQREGHVVNTASVTGLIGFPYIAPYVAAKHAIVGLSECLFHELAAIDSAVKVSVLCPGAVKTRFADADRNWPPRLGAPPTTSDDPGARAFREALRAGADIGLDPGPVAERVVDAVRTGRFMVLTEDTYGPHVLASLNGCLQGQPPLLPGVG